jgi:diguanylate cyclase (GGDEF)-like protein
VRAVGVVVHEAKLSVVLSEFARTMITDFPVQGILDQLVERVVEILPITSAGVTLIWAGQAPEYIAASDPSALRFERLQSDIGEGPCLASFASGQAVSVGDLADALDRFPGFAPAAAASGLAAVFAFPMRHGEERIGALDLYRETVGYLDPHDMEVAQTLADVACAYLLNARARDAARDAIATAEYTGLHDPLTGRANRTLLRERLDHAANRARRSRHSVAVLFADLDGFKAINDAHGHSVGDQILKAVADRLGRLVRPGDTLARMSGDEFVILCEDLRDPADVEIIITRINDAFATPLSAGTITAPLSVSVGSAYATADQPITDDLIKRADLEMYRVKGVRAALA